MVWVLAPVVTRLCFYNLLPDGAQVVWVLAPVVTFLLGSYWLPVGAGGVGAGARCDSCTPPTRRALRAQVVWVLAPVRGALKSVRICLKPKTEGNPKPENRNGPAARTPFGFLNSGFGFEICSLGTGEP